MRFTSLFLMQEFVFVLVPLQRIPSEGEGPPGGAALRPRRPQDGALPGSQQASEQPGVQPSVQGGARSLPDPCRPAGVLTSQEEPGASQ